MHISSCSQVTHITGVYSIPLSFVKAMMSLASPTPALVEALTEMTYGTYGSEIRGKNRSPLCSL